MSGTQAPGETPKGPGGRPSSYTEEMAAHILERLASGEMLLDICRDEGVPSFGSVYRWIAANEEFRRAYADAREIGLHMLVEETVGISDDGTNDWVEKQNPNGSTYIALNSEHITRSRLRVDTRKWLASKILPKIYGERIVQEHTGPNGGPIVSATITTDDPAEAARAYQRIISGEEG